ncbi:MAG: cytochrome c-type biogenesis protein CcmH [Myxococcales bacterium]|nr:cytochrome c-type biogenesis protein CcmH [Myxococcales bacterium]
MLIALSLVANLALAQEGYAPQRPVTDPLDATREARVQELGKHLRCAVCQGVSIADSPASMARAQLDKVRELVAQGKTDEEIYAYFVERYGEWALMEPKKSGVTLGLWVFPLLLLAVGLYVIWLQSKKGPTPAPPVSEEPKSEPSTDEYLAKVRADLEK